MAQAEAEAKEQCRAAQAEAGGHLAVLEAKQQQDDVLKAEIARLTAEVERLQDETDINKSYADATRSDIAKAEEEAAQLSEAVKAKEAEIEALRAQLLEGGATPECFAPLCMQYDGIRCLPDAPHKPFDSSRPSALLSIMLSPRTLLTSPPRPSANCLLLSSMSHQLTATWTSPAGLRYVSSSLDRSLVSCEAL